MDGHELLRLLRRCPVEELDLDARTLVDLLDRPRCQDCGDEHLDVWEAIACSEFVDARARRVAARSHRLAQLRDRERAAIDGRFGEEERPCVI